MLAQLPLCDVPGYAPGAYFSVLQPHTRLPAHTGTTNTRSIVHLPLVIPAGCGFRVGSQTRSWEASKAWVFDDTIEHGAWNDSEQVRIILIFDIWNPFLTVAERDLARAMTVLWSGCSNNGVAMIRTCVVLSLMAALSVPAAAKTDPLATGLRHCAAETDEAKRLACFDSLVATLAKIEADQFGLTRDLALKRDPVGEREADSAVLPGAIVALGQTPRGQLIFTLDNQQVWIQTELQQSKIFAVGDVVHIEHGAMGTLWLAADHARKTRVKRIN